jgi:hypothetical protein
VDRAGLAAWLKAYERAWRTPGTSALGDLFCPDASYRTAPYEEPYRGLAELADFWEGEREGPDETFKMLSEIVAVEGDTGVVRVEVTYGDPVAREYRDLWIVRFDESGRCIEFEEWPFWPAGQQGGWAPGPTR